MLKFVIGYFIIQILLLLIIFLVTNKTDKKSRKKTIDLEDLPDGFVKTAESYIDSKTNKTIHVYYNSSTGKRIYVENENR